MTLEINGLGEEMNLLVTQGALFGPIDATMTNPDGSPVNLTGSVIFGSVRKTAGSSAVGALISVSYPDPAAGKYRFWIEAANTNGLSAGEYLKSAESQHVWDLFHKDATGRVLPLYYGVVQVNRRVTRPTP